MATAFQGLDARIGRRATVTVEADVSQVDTQSTAVGALVEGTQIRNLPQRPELHTANDIGSGSDTDSLGRSRRR